MARMFTSGFRPKSTTKEAKNIIRKEMRAHYVGRNYYGIKKNDILTKIQSDANAGNAGMPDDLPRYKRPTDYQKCAYMVDSACFSIYDQDIMLSKIYGKKNVDNWSNDKKHNTYKHLIAREYVAMLNERKKQNGKKAY